MLSRVGCDVLMVLQHCQAHCCSVSYPCLQVQLTWLAADRGLDSRAATITKFGMAWSCRTVLSKVRVCHLVT